MSIFGGIRSGASGVFAQSQAFGMISDNISNVQTTGYKDVRARFSTLVTNSGAQSLHSPGGVRSNALSNIDKQGLLEAGDASTDIGIAGDGFFVVTDDAGGNGNVFLTRAGSFRPDQDGNLVNTAGYYLTGWPITTAGVVQQTSVLANFTPVNIGGLTGTPAPSENISLGANLPSTAATADAHSMTVQALDRQGGSHDLQLTFTKTANANEWTVTGTITNGLFDDGGAGVATGTLGTITFNADGTLGTVVAGALGTLNGDDLDLTMDYDSNTGTAPDQVTLTLDMGTIGSAVDGLTQFSGEFAPGFIENDGRSYGSLTDVSFAADGTMTASFDNGETRNIYQIPLATVNNPNGLKSQTGNAYSVTEDSGDALANVAGNGGTGTVEGGTLEASTVDLADEFTRMIITQRAFSASTRVISTGDELLDELVRIIR